MNSFGQAPTPDAPILGPPPVPADPQRLAQVKAGANWFYWIAGLSIVNTIAALSGTDWRFLLGLAVSQVVDAVAKDMGSVGQMAALVVNVFVIGIFVLFGVFANKSMKWAFLAGMTLFGLDTLVGLLFAEWISTAFHVYALWCLWRGYSAID